MYVSITDMLKLCAVTDVFAFLEKAIFKNLPLSIILIR